MRVSGAARASAPFASDLELGHAVERPRAVLVLHDRLHLLLHLWRQTRRPDPQRHGAPTRKGTHHDGPWARWIATDSCKRWRTRAAAARLLVVVLVIDLANERLKDVLERDDAARAAVLVDHHQHVQPLPTHQLQRVHRAHALWHKRRLLHDGRHGQLAQILPRKRRVAASKRGMQQEADLQEKACAAEMSGGVSPSGMKEGWQGQRGKEAWNRRKKWWTANEARRYGVDKTGGGRERARKGRDGERREGEPNQIHGVMRKRCGSAFMWKGCGSRRPHSISSRVKTMPLISSIVPLYTARRRKEQLRRPRRHRCSTTSLSPTPGGSQSRCCSIRRVAVTP
eukprot:2524193-Pleurochrysis_carterae.AAC.1